MSTIIAQTPAVVIRHIAVSSMDNNIYLLTCRRSGTRLLIDAADDTPAITRLLADSLPDGPWPALATPPTDGGPQPSLASPPADGEPQPSLIVTTHSHWDHVRALSDLAEATGAALLAGADDIPAITDGTGVTGISPLHHGDTVSVGDLVLTTITLRGHTPGSIALAYAEEGQPTHLFTGDSLFPGGVGNTWGDATRFASLLDDVATRLFGVYPDNTIVHPGHGHPTTLGAERPALPTWQARGW
jgi:glyoxylase-like metal-dependent hydrolase (beta-lactamase superfamily II)